MLGKAVFSLATALILRAGEKSKELGEYLENWQVKQKMSMLTPS